MTKRKKVIIAIISAAITVAVGVGAFFCINAIFSDDISFVINDTLPDGGGRRATVILLGGQSNASGCSRDEYLRRNVSEEKYAEYEAGYDNVYINYCVSGYHESQGFVKCGACQGEGGGYFGPELGMAESLAEEYPDELFFIIKYAWGGTNLYDQWLSPESCGSTGDLYKAFVAYVNSSMEYLISKNYDVRIEGMCWMQGESDSFSTEHAENYEIHLSNFILDVRDEFEDHSADGGIAFIDAYIADNPVYWVYCDLVNRSKQRVADASDLNVVIDTVAYGLTTSEEPEESPDMAHYDSMSEIKLGNLFIEYLAPFLD